MASKGMFSKARDKKPIDDLPGHTKLIAYELIRPAEDGSMHLLVMLDDIEPGGGIAPHYHDLHPSCDHAYYVISGEILASIGDKEEVVGPDTLIYSTTDVVHSLKNVGKTKAKLLRIGAAANGVTSGKSVFIKGSN